MHRIPVRRNNTSRAGSTQLSRVAHTRLATARGLRRRPAGAPTVRDKLRVLLVDERADRARDLARTLEDSGCQVVAQLSGPVDLHDTLRAVQPDVVIVDMDSPDRDTLEDMQRITSEQPRPIVMFVDESDSESIRTAVRAGVAAYVVKGASPERIRPVLEVACARFEEFQALRDELARAQSTLAERKVIERAKGILMQKRGFSEDAAFAALRRMAMNQGIRLVEVARHVLAAAEVI
jgi:response regulator NasT